MFKLNRLSAMLLLVVFVGVAWGAANKISSFGIEDSFINCIDDEEIPLTINPAADGMAILNYVPGSDKTIVQVIVSDFTGAPLQRCIVRLDPDVGDLGTFLTDSQGNGHFHGEIAGNQSASNVELYQDVDPRCPAIRVAFGK